MSDLRARCKQFNERLTRNAILRQGSPVDDLVAFVVSETGRAADPSLKETLPLCLYFVSEKDRDEFVALIRDVKPFMVTKKMP